MLAKYRNAESTYHQKKAHTEYFEVEDELKKFLKDKSIAKLFGVVKIPSKIMKLQPSRGPAINETFMAIYEYLDPYTNTSEMVTITYEDGENEDGENEDGENEDDENEDDENEDGEKKDNE